MQKYFKQFQSLAMITYLELGVTDGVSVGVNICLETGEGYFERYL
jgi:hypothetical protein